MARGVILLTAIVTREEREAYRLAADVLGYASLSEMIREAMEQRLARARRQTEHFDGLLADKKRKEHDDGGHGADDRG